MDNIDKLVSSLIPTQTKNEIKKLHMRSHIFRNAFKIRHKIRQMGATFDRNPDEIGHSCADEIPYATTTRSVTLRSIFK